MSEKSILENMLKLQSSVEQSISQSSALDKKLEVNQKTTDTRLNKIEVGQSILKQDVHVLKQDVSILKTTVIELDKRTHKMAIQFEGFGDKLDIALEGILSNQAQIISFNTTRTQVDDHEHRISAMEHFVRKHPN